jgi:sirohydrochlorin cobaltochelatase
MRHKLLFGLLTLFAFNMVLQAQHNNEKRGILLVTFGTSYPEARKAFDNIDTRVKAQWPGVEVRWAYTSGFIRAKLHKKGIEIDSPAKALAIMSEEGFTQVAVQSLHIFPGAEFHDLVNTVKALTGIPGGIEQTTIGRPLISRHEDLEQMAGFVHAQFSGQLNDKKALLLMGHGTSHGSNIYYPGFQYYLDLFPEHIEMGTVEGFPSLDNAIARLKQEHIREVVLTPFMSVAGDHAQNDMAGEDDKSWKSVLKREGFSVDVVMKGLAEYDKVVDLWISHLKDAYNEL